MATEATERAVALRDEFLSVDIPAEHIEPNAFHREHAVLVKTGTIPPTVQITVGEGYRWLISGRRDQSSAASAAALQHGHDLPRRTPASDVVELVALCVAEQCQKVPALRMTLIIDAAAAVAGREEQEVQA